VQHAGAETDPPQDCQFSRNVNCNSREPLPLERVLSTPSPPTLLGLPGWLSTLKKSALKRRLNLSVIGTLLNNEASNPHCRVLGKYWLRQGLIGSAAGFYTQRHK